MIAKDSDISKNCSKCKEDKLLSEFHKNKSEKDGLHHYCKVCNNRQKINMYAKDPGYRKRCRLLSVKHKYGLTEEELNLKFINQNESCAVCNKKLILYHRETHIDHNHKTGEVRDILCMNCNFVLGLSGENIEYLKTMILYIEQHNKP